MSISDEEFIADHRGEATRSPLIAELCRRLEDAVSRSVDTKYDCPVCSASLTVSVDDSGDVLLR